MDIKVAAFTVGEKSSNTGFHIDNNHITCIKLVILEKQLSNKYLFNYPYKKMNQLRYKYFIFKNQSIVARDGMLAGMSHIAEKSVLTCEQQRRRSESITLYHIQMTRFL